MDGITINELIADQIEAQFQKVSVGGKSELDTYAYQWAEWNGGIEKKVGEFNYSLLIYDALAYRACAKAISGSYSVPSPMDT